MFYKNYLCTILPGILVLTLLGLDFSKANALDLDQEKIRVKPPKSDIAVVQNRYFNKALRPEIGIFYGKIMNESYTDTTYTGFRLALFFTENFGMELSSADSDVSDSDDRKALNELKYRELDSDKIVFPDPEVNSVFSAKDFSVFFSPLYGKMNVLDQFIIYSDLYLTAGYSMLETSQGDIGALSYGVGQRLYFTKSLSFRWDLKIRNYDEQRSGQTSNKNSFNMDFGISYFVL